MKFCSKGSGPAASRSSITKNSKLGLVSVAIIRRLIVHAVVETVEEVNYLLACILGNLSLVQE